MKHTIYSCECIFDNLIQMTSDEIERVVSDYSILSKFKKWLLIIEELNEILFFCVDCVDFSRSFMRSYIMCLKKTPDEDESCVDYIYFGGINDVCKNCLEVISAYMKMFLIKIKNKKK